MITHRTPGIVLCHRRQAMDQIYQLRNQLARVALEVVTEHMTVIDTDLTSFESRAAKARWYIQKPNNIRFEKVKEKEHDGKVVSFKYHLTSAAVHISILFPETYRPISKQVHRARVGALPCNE